MTAALAAQEIVRSISQPEPGDTVARQIHKVAKILGMDKSDRDLRRVRDAWYGRAGPSILHQIRTRVDESFEYRIAEAIEAMNEADPKLFASHVEALSQFVRKSNGVGGPQGG